MPIQMQQGKLRGSTSKDAMPIGPFRTFTQGVNVSTLGERFEAGAEVTPETLMAVRVLRHLNHPVKILGNGELSVALTVTAHGFSAAARQKIEAAGGTAIVLGSADEPPITPVADSSIPLGDPPTQPETVEDEPEA